MNRQRSHSPKYVPANGSSVYAVRRGDGQYNVRYADPVKAASVNVADPERRGVAAVVADYEAAVAAVAAGR